MRLSSSKASSVLQHARAKSITTPQTTHQRTTARNKNNMTEQHGALTLLKTDHLLLGPGGYDPTIATEQGEQSNNIDVQAVNWEINLLNKYYPGLGQVTLQPVQQLFLTNPLLARQWAKVPQEFSQDQYLEKDKFPDPNVQAETHVNSETQTNKINQQQTTGSNTAILSAEDKQHTNQEQYKNGLIAQDNRKDITQITQLRETAQSIRKEPHIYTDHLGKKYIYPAAWILGQTSQLKETGGRGPGTINTVYAAKIDKGGRSYGSYQIIQANMQDYLKHSQFKDEFKGLKVNSQAFNDTWQKIAKEHPKEFWLDQHNYIERTHYAPLIANLKRDGIDIADRGPALKDMIWSTAVQYGANTPVIANALIGRKVDNISNEEIIITVQDYKRKNVDKLFRGSLHLIRIKKGIKEMEKYRNSLINRAISEKDMLLKLQRKSTDIKRISRVNNIHE